MTFGEVRYFGLVILSAFVVQPLYAKPVAVPPAAVPSTPAVSPSLTPAQTPPPIVFQSGTGNDQPTGQTAAQSSTQPLPQVRYAPPPRPQISCASFTNARARIDGQFYPASTPGALAGNRILAKSVFDKAMDSYFINVCGYGRTAGPGVIIVVDFAKHSREPRLYRIDLTTATGLDTPMLVAHGSGSDRDDDGFAESFSNTPESLASSLGAARGAEIYEGQNGRSLRLDGLDSSNYLMRDRDIVVHSYAPQRRRYFNASLVAARAGTPGRSEGCFVVEPDKRELVLQTLANGGFLYAGYSGVLPQPAIVRPAPANATVIFASGTGTSPRSVPPVQPPVSGIPGGTSGSPPTAPISPAPVAQEQ